LAGDFINAFWPLFLLKEDCMMARLLKKFMRLKKKDILPFLKK